MRRPSITLYLVAGFLFLVVLPLNWVGNQRAQPLRAKASEEADESLRFAALEIRRSLNDLIDAYTRAAVSLAKRLELEKKPLASLDRVQRLLDSIHRGYGELTVVLFCDLNGVARVATPALIDASTPVAGTSYADRDWFQEVRRTGRPAISKVLLSRIRGLPSVVIAAPVFDAKGTLSAMVALSIPFTQLSGMVSTLTRSLPDATLLGLDGDDRAVLRSRFEGAGSDETMARAPPIALYAPISEALVVRTDKDEHGVPMRAAGVSLSRSGMNWRLFVMRPLSSVFGRAEEARQGWGLASRVAAVGGLLFTLLSMVLISWPMVRLSRLARSIGSGDLREPPPPTRWWSPRETQELNGAMTRMQAELRNSVQIFGTLQETLETARTEIRNLVTEQGTSVSSQTDQLRYVATFARDLHFAATEAGRDADAIVTVADRAEEARQAGQEALGATFEQLAQVQGQFSAVAEVTRTLEVQVDYILQINSNIDAIAGQSNLLSINAAIQAMRAGEAGKGFSIIARSIRELSDSSQRSRKQVNEAIRESREQLHRASERNLGGKERIELGLAQLRASGGSLKTLAGTVEDSARAAQNVARSVSKQRTAVDRIDQGISTLEQAMGTLVERGERADRAAAQMDDASRQLATFLSRFRA